MHTSLVKSTCSNIARRELTFTFVYLKPLNKQGRHPTVGAIFSGEAHPAVPESFLYLFIVSHPVQIISALLIMMLARPLHRELGFYVSHPTPPQKLPSAMRSTQFEIL